MKSTYIISSPKVTTSNYHSLLHVDIVETFLLVLRPDGAVIVRLEHGEPLLSAHEAVEVLEAVRVEDGVRAPAAEPDVRVQEVVQQTAAQKWEWQLPLVVHGSGKVGHHVDVL